MPHQILAKFAPTYGSNILASIIASSKLGHILDRRQRRIWLEYSRAAQTQRTNLMPPGQSVQSTWNVCEHTTHCRRLGTPANKARMAVVNIMLLDLPDIDM